MDEFDVLGRTATATRRQSSMLWLRLLLAIGGLCIWSAVSWRWTSPVARPPGEIFAGVTYLCEELNEGPEGQGLAHLVRIDLSAPGIELYATPLDSGAVGAGYHYRLTLPSWVARREGLAVAINATMFSARMGKYAPPWDLAGAVQTVVSDGEVSHIHPHSYMLWFDSKDMPRLEFTKPPSADALAEARWAVSGGAVPLWQGEVRPSAAGREVDSQTAIGFDRTRRILWLAAFESVSPLKAVQVLARHGASHGILLDSGSSTSMVIGRGAKGIRSGRLIGGWRPVATVFGVRAKRLE